MLSHPGQAAVARLQRGREGPAQDRSRPGPRGGAEGLRWREHGPRAPLGPGAGVHSPGSFVDHQLPKLKSCPATSKWPVCS